MGGIGNNRGPSIRVSFAPALQGTATVWFGFAFARSHLGQLQPLDLHTS